MNGGSSNTADAPDSVVSGGYQNTASGDESVVGGGASGESSDTYDWAAIWPHQGW